MAYLSTDSLCAHICAPPPVPGAPGTAHEEEYLSIHKQTIDSQQFHCGPDALYILLTKYIPTSIHGIPLRTHLCTLVRRSAQHCAYSIYQSTSRPCRSSHSNECMRCSLKCPSSSILFVHFFIISAHAQNQNPAFTVSIIGARTSRLIPSVSTYSSKARRSNCSFIVLSRTVS